MQKIINTLATTVFLMSLFGIVVVASATEQGNVTNFAELLRGRAVKQLIWLAVALSAGVLVSRADYRLYKRPDVMMVMFGVSVVLLSLVFVPGIGASINGSHRWINCRFMNLQPSEFVKLVMVALTCAWIDRVGWHVQRFKQGILYPGLAIGIIVGLLLLETDMGATMVLLVVCGVILFAAGARLAHLAPIAVLGLVLLVAVMMLIPNRRTRFFSFVNAKLGTEYSGLVVDEADKKKMKKEQDDKRYHVEQSLEAFKNGGLTGVGFMHSIQKKYYLPEAHTDFIFAIAGEEFGFIASALVVLGFMTVLTCGVLIALRAPDRFGRFLAFGLTFLLIFQAGFNLGVVTDLLPTKGIALTFLSYGGTNLLASMIAIGVILNIGHAALEAEAFQDANAFRDAVKI